MEGGEELHAAYKLIRDLRCQVDSLKKRIQVLELENARLLSLSNAQQIHDESETKQGHQDGNILSPRLGQPHKIAEAENSRGVHMFEPTEYNFSTLSIDDKEYVTIQGTSMEGISNSVSLNMQSVVVGNAVVKVTTDVDRDHEMQKDNTLEGVDFINEHLRDPGTVFEQTKLDNFQLNCNNGFSEASGVCIGHKSKKQKAKLKRDGLLQDVSHCSRRYVALKIMYFGQRFYGFASEAQLEPTVESEIFAALKKTRLLIGERNEAHYSRCGRTDKGVSAFGQVIALYLRSKYMDTSDGKITVHMPSDSISDEKEIDYVRVLNRALPKDIRVIGWCPIPFDFHARFSCLSREYKYFFFRENLDISGMEIACSKFLGEHDFRNFCKMDALNVHNYRRRITTFEIVPCSERWASTEIMALRIKGSSFLWHQVRCMAAVLFMVGRGVESPSVIDELLDTNKTFRKPQYTIASELPLVLCSCEFEGLSFRCSSDAASDIHMDVSQKLQAHLLQAVIFHEASSQLTGSAIICNTLMSKRGKKKALHVALSSRPTEPTYEERHKKLNAKSGYKYDASDFRKQLLPLE